MILSTLSPNSSPEEARLALEEVFSNGKGVDEGKLFELFLEAKGRLQELGLDKDYVRLAKIIYKKYLTIGENKRKGKAAPSMDSTPEHNEVGAGAKKLLESGVVIRIEDILSKFQEGMLMTDTIPLEAALAATVSHELRGENDKQAWMMLEGSPSTGKTEIIEALVQHPKTYALSEFGKKTLASGLRPEDSYDGKDPSLINKLKDNILTFKDFTTILSGDSDEKKAIFGQLREIFDGSFRKPFANGVMVDWTGHITFIGGVTGVIDHQFKFIQQLGPRFLFVRLKEEDRDLVAEMALKKQPHWKLDFQDLVGAFFRSLPYPLIELSNTDARVMIDLANVISMGRYTPLKNREGDITELPEQEMPPRLTQQFASLLKSFAIVNRRETIIGEDIQKVVRVGMDTLPPSRRYILEKLLDEKAHTITDIKKDSKYEGYMLKSGIDDLYMGNLIERENVEGEGGYKLSSETIRRLQSIKPYLVVRA